MKMKHFRRLPGNLPGVVLWLAVLPLAAFGQANYATPYPSTTLAGNTGYGSADATNSAARVGAERQALRGHVPEAVARLKLPALGRLPATNRLNLAIGLPLRNTNALTRLLHDLYDPASPQLPPLPDAGTVHRAVRADGTGLPGGHRVREANG